MSKRVKCLPEEFILKVSLGITCLFKFKSKEANFKAFFMGDLYLMKQLPDAAWTNTGIETIDSINCFISSGMFYHWHVDTGVRGIESYLKGKRFPVYFERSS